jgi:hypothetical protein
MRGLAKGGTPSSSASTSPKRARQSVEPKAITRSARARSGGRARLRERRAQERRRERARVVVGAPLRGVDEVGELGGLGLARGHEPGLDADDVAHVAKELHVAVALVFVDAHAEGAQAVEHHQREEQRGGRHVVLVDGQAPGLGAPRGRAREHAPHGRVHEPHLHGDDEALARAVHTEGRRHGLDEAARLGEASRRLLREPAREREGLVARGRRIPKHDRAAAEHGAAQPARADQDLAPAREGVAIDPGRGLVERGEERAQRRGRVGHGVDASPERALEHGGALARRQRRERLDHRVGEGIASRERGAELVDPGTETLAGARRGEKPRGPEGRDGARSRADLAPRARRVRPPRRAAPLARDHSPWFGAA